MDAILLLAIIRFIVQARHMFDVRFDIAWLSRVRLVATGTIFSSLTILFSGRGLAAVFRIGVSVFVNVFPYVGMFLLQFNIFVDMRRFYLKF